VGRSDRRAYAYLLVPPETPLSEIARKRLAAIQEFSDLGAGFRIAALDLELRGAGNLLGGEQSGHLEAVGLDLYVKLLEQTILELKGEAPRETPRATLNLKVDLRIPEDYVPEAAPADGGLQAGQPAARRDGGRAAEQGPPGPLRPLPPPVESLLLFARQRLRLEGLGVLQADLAGGALHLRIAPETPLRAEAVTDLVRRLPGASLSPQGVLRAPVAAGETPLLALAALLDRLERAAPPSVLVTIMVVLFVGDR
jgi:transcription-repair coupling factor (superfamily II helicase)